MTHRNNYQYVKKWREANRDKYLQAKRGYCLKSYYYKQGIKELMRIDLEVGNQMSDNVYLSIVRDTQYTMTAS